MEEKMDSNFYIKTNRAFTFIRNYAWIITILIAVLGFWVPKLGLIVIPIMLALFLTSFFKGRFWCGNFCPHGSLFDNIYIKVSQNKTFIRLFKSVIFRTIFFSWFAFQITSRLIKAFSNYGTEDFFDKLGLVFVTTYLMVMIISFVLSVGNNARTWCNICPMGTIQTVSYNAGKFFKLNLHTDEKITIEDKNSCHICGKCTRVCPMQLEVHTNFDDNNQFSEDKCLRCSTCVNNCPAGILNLKNIKEIKIKDHVTLNEKREKISSKIIKVEDLSHDLREFTFEFLEPSVINCIAGQFILLKISDSPLLYRAYSISSISKDKSTLSVIIKKVENGYGTNIIWNDYTVGKTVELIGPMGEELILDKNAKSVLFVANGIGITPFIPLVEDALSDDSQIEEVILVAGVRDENDLIYDDYFRSLKRKYSNFKYISVASKPRLMDTKKGYVSDIIKDMQLVNPKVYMCGSKPMIASMNKLLIEKGVDKDDIFFESA